jgi:radical SAM-linked protein
MYGDERDVPEKFRERTIGDERMTTSDKVMLAVIKFKVQGNFRFLSHAETLKLFQRACVRAGINVQYSQGFNPRPRMSLPLPRSVGVESDDELLYMRFSHKTNSACGDMNASQVGSRLSGQLPQGCELISVDFTDANVSFRPCLKTYIISVRQEHFNKKLRARIEQLLRAKNLYVERKTGKNGTTHNIDVRSFFESIDVNNQCIVVECNISPDGSIRVEEILRLLELDVEQLSAPVKRANVQWEEVQ